MGVIYLLCVALLFSFGGTCAKTIGPYFRSEYISFFRFAVGVLFLFLLKLLKRHHFAKDYRQQLRSYGGWLLFGAAGKAVSYLTENYALTHGVSYGNILTQPAQLLFLTFLSVVVLKEKLTGRKALFLIPCVAGVLLVSWNGRALSDYLSGGLLLTCMYLISGMGSGCHIFAQKKLNGKMDIIDSNITMFTVSALITFVPTVPLTAAGAIEGVSPSLACIGAIALFGFITGIGFYLNAKAIPLVPLYMVPLIQCTMVIFAILWGVLFFHEPLTGYLIVGAVLFVSGIVGVQIA